VRSQAQRAEVKGQLHLFWRKVGHAKTPGAYNDQPKNRTQTVRRNTKISHPQNEQRNKPVQKLAGLLGLNSPQSKPKHKTGATNQTQLNETEKGIGGS
jgi:hypothetical protein